MANKSSYAILMMLLAISVAGCSSAKAEETMNKDKKYSFTILLPNEKSIEVLKAIEADYKQKSGLDMDNTYYSSYPDGGAIQIDLHCIDSIPNLMNSVSDFEKIDDRYSELLQKDMDSKCLEHFKSKNEFYSFPVGIISDPNFYYDKSVISENEINNWDDILLKVGAMDEDDYKVALPLLGPIDYYALFDNNGVRTTFSANGNNDTLYSETGLRIAKSLSELLNHPHIDSENFCLSEESRYIASAGANYQKENIESYFGDNVAHKAGLPSLSREGYDFSWGSYCRTISLAVAKQNDDDDRKVLMDFASYVSKLDSLLRVLTNEADQFCSVYKDSPNCINRYQWLYEKLDECKDYTGYSFGWSNAMSTLIERIKLDHGNLNDEYLMGCLKEYHDAVIRLS